MLFELSLGLFKERRVDLALNDLREMTAMSLDATIDVTKNKDNILVSLMLIKWFDAGLNFPVFESQC